MLSDSAQKRLVQVLGMLGSDHDGEVLNAARLAEKYIRDHKLTWEEIFNACAQPLGGANRAAGGWGRGEEGSKNKDLNAAYLRGFEDGVNSVKPAKPFSWRAWARERIEHDEDCLSGWEINFFGSFGDGRYAVPTERQKAIFERVAVRLGLELPPESPRHGMNGA